MSKRRKPNTSPSEPTRTLPRRSHTCPICQTSIPLSDLPSHYTHERNLLLSTPQQSTSNKPAKRPAAVLALSKIIDHRRNVKRTEESIVLASVRANREARRKGLVMVVERGEECPVCGVEVRGNRRVFNEHVTACVDAQNLEDEEEEGDNWDVYTFGGQTRVRAMGLLEGGVTSLPDPITHTNNDNDGVDVFVDIEGDTDAVYGKPQYTESDLHNPDSISKDTKSSGSNEDYGMWANGSRYEV